MTSADATATPTTQLPTSARLAPCPANRPPARRRLTAPARITYITRNLVDITNRDAPDKGGVSTR